MFLAAPPHWPPRRPRRASLWLPGPSRSFFRALKRLSFPHSPQATPDRRPEHVNHILRTPLWNIFRTPPPATTPGQVPDLRVDPKLTAAWIPPSAMAAGTTAMDRVATTAAALGGGNSRRPAMEERCGRWPAPPRLSTRCALGGRSGLNIIVENHARSRSESWWTGENITQFGRLATGHWNKGADRDRRGARPSATRAPLGQGHLGANLDPPRREKLVRTR